MNLDNIQNEYEDLMKSTFEVNVEETKYNDRWEGVVIDNEDPDKLGRIRIKILNLYDDIPKEHLPWAIPDIQYLGSKCGNFIVPEINSVVRGYFDQGDIQKPIYDSIAFNKDNIDNSKANNREDYPHKMILFQTDQGDFLTLNRKTGEFVFFHRTGASLIYDKEGNLSIDTGATDSNQGNLTINVLGNSEIKVTGQSKIESQGNCEINSTTGQVNIGLNPAKQLVNNLPCCLVTGAPHYVGNTNVFV